MAGKEESRELTSAALFELKRSGGALRSVKEDLPQSEGEVRYGRSEGSEGSSD
jgi:hypothetical protein